MLRRPLILCALLLALIAAGGIEAIRLWRQQERAATARAGVAPLPDLSRWPAELRERLARESAAVAAARDPAQPLAALALLYCANGFSPEGERALAALRRLDPGNPRWPYLLADLHLRAGEKERAEAPLRAAVERDPGYAPAWLRLGELLADLGANDRARECFARAVSAAPGSLWAAYDLAYFDSQHGAADASLRRLRELEAAHPAIKEFHELLADLLAARDPAASARERRLASASELNMGTQDPWTDDLAQSCYDSTRMMIHALQTRREGRYGETERLLQRVIALAPQSPANPLGWDLLSNFYLMTGKPGEARSVLEKAVAEFPDEPQMPVLLSRLLRTEHEAGEATAVVRRAVERWPGRADLQAALGAALEDAGRHAEAADALREALRLDPTQTEAQYTLGSCLLELGQRGAAHGAFERALSMRPDYPEALYALGAMELEAGDYAAAKPRIDRLYGLNPDDPNARHLVAAWHLVRGMAARQAGDLDEADGQYRSGLEYSPDFGAILIERGSLALQRGRYAEAVASLERCVRAEPEDPQGYRALGQALLGAGRTDDARDVFRRGLGVALKLGDSARAEEFRGLLGR